MKYIASRVPYEKSRDELSIFYKGINEWNSMYVPIFKVNSKEESVNSDITDNTDSVNSNGEIVKGSRHDLNVNASEMLAGLVANKEPTRTATTPVVLSN